MDSWYHFIPERDVAVTGNKPTKSIDNSNVVHHHQEHCHPKQKVCFRSNSITTVGISSVVLPEKYDPALEILRSFSSESPMQATNKSQSCSDTAYDGSYQAETETTEGSQIPRRNLTEAFEELYIQPPESAINESKTPLVKQSMASKGDGKATNMISPTGVADLEVVVSAVTPSKDEVVGKLDEKLGFKLHPSLQRDLSEALVQRVSFYAIIHDINKEANSMAANDDSGYNRVAEEVSEEFDPLVVAVQGYPKPQINGTSSMVNVAMIDEEQWLLDTIDARSSKEARIINACPPTFPQAMGERDYDNSLAALSNGSRTQLWKPSRSWWEAKSGKNPWIEPKNHNKRWR